MGIFFSADQHFGADENSWKYRYRPFDSPQEADSQMAKLWNKYITNDDIVYHLGDFAIKDDAIGKFIKKLNGKEIILIVGNHDYKRDQDILLSYFTAVYYKPFELEFDKKYDIHNEGNSLWLCHYPLQRHEKLYTCTGHIHSLWQIAKRMINVGVDANHFRPVSLEQVLSSRHSEKVGHWDANVYPDADINWQIEVSTKIKRDETGNEPTLDILRKKSGHISREEEKEQLKPFSGDHPKIRIRNGKS